MEKALKSFCSENIFNAARKADSLQVVVAGLAIFVFFFLLFRNIGLYPTVFADEYTYSKLSRLLPLAESSIPGYLYLWLYSYTNYCGDGFLECAKLINNAFFVGAVPFIFLIARRVAGPYLSLAVSFLAIIGPISSYTAYFMPESFYFLSFWVLCWCLLNIKPQSGRCVWFAAGTIYGVSSLIKPHSIFFLPAVIIYIAFVFFQGRPLFYRQFFIAFALFIAASMLTKFGVGYLLAGPAGLTIFGPLYGSIASSAASGVDKYIQLLSLAFENVNGHALALTLIYGLPLTLAATLAFNSLFRKAYSEREQNSQSARLERVAVLSLVVVLNMICVVALFTASVANSGPSETPYRLHMRYYNFALPLLYIVAAGVFSKAITIGGNARYFFGTVVAILGVFAVWTDLAPYTPSFIDSPEIRGLHVDHLYFLLVGGLLISALALWLVSQHYGLRLYLYIALPFFVAVSSFHVWSEQNNRLVQDVYDKAGIFTKQYLSNEDLSKTVIVGSDAAGLFRSLYYLDNAKASFEIIPRDVDYDLQKLPTGKDWVLVIGEHGLLGKPFYQVSMNGFSLVRASGEYFLDFKRGAWPGIVRKVSGLSTPELWGAWSQSDIVTLEFAGSLPSKFEIHLVASAFGPNVDKQLEVSVGDRATNFSLSASAEKRIIRLDNPNRFNELRFKFPNATSPKALGLSGDERKLGVGFIEMKIVSIR